MKWLENEIDADEVDEDGGWDREKKASTKRKKNISNIAVE